jgi:hypothetical protein
MIPTVRPLRRLLLLIGWRYVPEATNHATQAALTALQCTITGRPDARTGSSALHNVRMLLLVLGTPWSGHEW